MEQLTKNNPLEHIIESVLLKSQTALREKGPSRLYIGIPGKSHVKSHVKSQESVSKCK